MSAENTLNPQDVPALLPSFVRLNGAQSIDPARAFDFWVTEPSGDDWADYSTGQDNFGAAVRFAHVTGSRTFLSFIVGAIGGSKVSGAMESGFLDALASAAATSSPVELDAEAMAQPVMAKAAQWANEIIGRRSSAAIRDDIARQMANAANRIYAGAVLHCYCRAALLGSKN